MEDEKKPEDITLQRISYRNIDRIEKLGRGKRKESFNDVLTRVLDELEENKKEIKRLNSELKSIKKGCHEQID